MRTEPMYIEHKLTLNGPARIGFATWTKSRRGLRYRVNSRFDLDGLRRRRADLVFLRRRVAVFVDGCFWHSCPEHGTSPRANAAWWAQKLAGNVARGRSLARARERNRVFRTQRGRVARVEIALTQGSSPAS